MQKSAYDGLFRWTLIFCLAYFSYRYPLQINSSTTSPTYSDTPFALQIGKYVALGALGALAFVFACVQTRRTRLDAIDILLMFFFAAWLALKSIFSPTMATIEFAVAIVIPLVIVISTSEVDTARLGKILSYTIFIGIVVDLVQIVLFFTTGRLPALAYENSLSVRFGSFMDDPNGFGALCFLLLGYATYAYEGKTRAAAVVGIYMMLLATQSLTCLGFAGLLAGCYVAWRCFVKVDWRTWLGVGIAVLLGTVLWEVLYDTVEAMIALKSGSIEQHADSVTFSHISSWTEWLYGGDSVLEGESWWTTSLVNYGIAFVAPFLLFAGRVCILCLQQFLEATEKQTKACLFGILLFQIFVTVSLLNLPFLRIFPINFLFFLFSWLILQRKVGGEAQDPLARMKKIALI